MAAVTGVLLLTTAMEAVIVVVTAVAIDKVTPEEKLQQTDQKQVMEREYHDRATMSISPRSTEIALKMSATEAQELAPVN